MILQSIKTNNFVNKTFHFALFLKNGARNFKKCESDFKAVKINSTDGAFHRCFAYIPYAPVKGSRKRGIFGVRKVKRTKRRAMMQSTEIAALGERQRSFSI